MSNNLLNTIKVLSNKHRVEILCIINKNNGNMCYADVYNQLKMPQQTFNYHIKKLESVKIILSKRQKQKWILFINKEQIEKTKQLFNKTFDF